MASRMPAPRTLTAASLALVVAAGCGSGGGSVHERTGRFTVVMDDFFMRPQELSVPRGRLTLTVVNHGRIAHAFRLRAGKNPESRLLLRISTLKPGGSFTRSFRLHPGRYRMFDAIGNHEELGTYGTLVVRR